MSTGINVTKPIRILDEGVLLTSDVSQIDFTGGVTATTVGNNVTVNVPAAGITVGTTPVTSGTDGRVFFQAGGVVQQDANFTFDNTLKRLTLKAVGTAGTDIPFAVQNSGGTANIFTVTGNNQVWSNGSGNISSNTSFGEGSLNSNTTGQFNTAYGKNALRLNTTGQINTAIGFDVLRTNTTGSNNIALGTNALYSNLGGGSNLAIGNSPLYNNTSGVSNIAIGDGALQTNTVGSYNTSIGSSSLFLNTSGQYNVAYGITALRSNTTGQINTAIGHESLFANTTGNNNAAIGYNSGRFISGGVTSNTITNNSVFLGAQTKSFADNQTNQIVIGYDSTGLGSNTSVIGNSSTTLFRPYGNVAIGADTAGARLDVRAQGALSTDITFRVRNSADTYNIFSVQGDSKAIFLAGVNNATTSNTFSVFGDNINTVVEVGGWDTSGSRKRGFRASSSNTGNYVGNFIDYGNITGGASGSGHLEYLGTARMNFANFSNNTTGWAFMHSTNTSSIAVGNTVFAIYPTNAQAGGGTLALGTTLGTTISSLPAASYGKNTFFIASGTAPTTTGADAFGLYSADITAGNAAPHFITENGAIVKVYQETTAVASATLVSNAGTAITDTDTFDGYTLKQIVKALRNQGLLA